MSGTRKPGERRKQASNANEPATQPGQPCNRASHATAKSRVAQELKPEAPCPLMSGDCVA